MTDGYTKLFSTLILSSVWCESKDVKVLWVTMLALTNKHSRVDGSVPGLAKQAQLTIEETEAALAVLESPDPHSRNTGHEGRRIEKVEGGWMVLNHAEYRRKLDASERKEYLRQKQAEYRAAKKLSQANGLEPVFKPKMNKTAAERQWEDEVG